MNSTTRKEERKREEKERKKHIKAIGHLFDFYNPVNQKILIFAGNYSQNARFDKLGTGLSISSLKKFTKNGLEIDLVHCGKEHLVHR